MDTVWKSRAVVEGYLQRRAAVPMLQQEYDLILRVIRSAKQEVGCFLDLGCGDGVLAALVLGEYQQARGTLVDFSEPMRLRRIGFQDVDCYFKFLEIAIFGGRRAGG